MKLQTTVLVIVFLTTASAKPIGLRLHHDADIADNDCIRLYGNKWWCIESTSYKDSSSSDQSLESSESSESSESQSSEESSEEVLVTDQTTPVVTTSAVTTMTTGDRSTLTPEPDTMGTDEPTVSQTPQPGTPATSVDVTSPSSVTGCVTEEIPTAAPITNNRGDN